MTPSASSPAPTVLISPDFDAVLHDIAQDPNLPRLKKLLVYACTQVWESNPQRLETIDLRNLLYRLLELAPTLAQLQEYLNQLTASLNKPEEYALVATAFVTQASRLYSEWQPAQSSLDRLNFEPIAQVLEQDADPLRLKKLLLLACRNQWESDPTRLAQVSTLRLVQELYALAPELTSLSAVLNSLVKTLSKPVEYGRLAERAIAALQPLYIQATPLPDMTQVLAAPLPAAPLPALPPKPAAPESIGSKPAAPEPAAPELAAPEPIDSKPIAAPPERARPVKVRPPKLIDVFDVRLELMQYVNPLRAKILLFSLLHEPFRSCYENYQMLKSYEMDGLLRLLVQTRRQYNLLRQELIETADRLEDVDQYRHAADVICRVLRPFYPADAAQATMAPALLTRIHSEDEDFPEQTCQVHSQISGATLARSPIPAPGRREP